MNKQLDSIYNELDLLLRFRINSKSKIDKLIYKNNVLSLDCKEVYNYDLIIDKVIFQFNLPVLNLKKNCNYLYTIKYDLELYIFLLQVTADNIDYSSINIISPEVFYINN